VHGDYSLCLVVTSRNGVKTVFLAGASEFAYKQMPLAVYQPLMHLLSWLLWAVLVLCLSWLLVSAGRFWSAMRSGYILGSDAAHGVMMSLIGALVASSATTIALALLPAG
jgi:hypothetical protein